MTNDIDVQTSRLPDTSTTRLPVRPQRAELDTGVESKHRRWLVEAPRYLDLAARSAALAVGFALLVATTVNVFTDSAVSAAALVAGGLLLLAPTIVDRLQSVKVHGVELRLTHQIAAAGAPRGASLLERVGLARELDQYALIYTQLAGESNKKLRANLLDRIVSRVSAVSAVEKFDAAEVRALFFNGTPVMRVLALGLMEGDISLASGDVLLEAVRRSLTGNEQFHALQVTERAWNRLEQPERAELAKAVEESPHIAPGSDRAAVVQKLRALPGYGERPLLH